MHDTDTGPVLTDCEGAVTQSTERCRIFGGLPSSYIHCIDLEDGRFEDAIESNMEGFPGFFAHEYFTFIATLDVLCDEDTVLPTRKEVLDIIMDHCAHDDHDETSDVHASYDYLDSDQHSEGTHEV